MTGKYGVNETMELLFDEKFDLSYIVISVKKAKTLTAWRGNLFD